MHRAFIAAFATTTATRASRHHSDEDKDGPRAVRPSKAPLDHQGVPDVPATLRGPIGDEPGVAMREGGGGDAVISGHRASWRRVSPATVKHGQDGSVETAEHPASMQHGLARCWCGSDVAAGPDDHPSPAAPHIRARHDDVSSHLRRSPTLCRQPKTLPPA
ncbi:hypothetical protein GCM10022232_93360 [Streptomyces plumbiresistens]|uniref:Secreted protein n=1 Tax=Streptomyces plumbiresistens TaxID=511811 RepID=A0ABP7TY17_9ACTN